MQLHVLVCVGLLALTHAVAVLEIAGYRVQANVLLIVQVNVPKDAAVDVLEIVLEAVVKYALIHALIYVRIHAKVPVF